MNRLDKLGGRTAVVTGGASGIGLGIARRLTDEGMRVVLADVERDALAAAGAGLGLHTVVTDVSDEASVNALAEEVLDRFGAVHVLCNNAGVGPIAPLVDTTPDDWRWMIGVNLFGVIHGVRAFLPHLLANPDGGHVVNTSSVHGLFTLPDQGAYSVTKFGVVAYTETLAAELAGTRVGATVLCPGTVRTNIATSSRNRPTPGGGLADFEISEDTYRNHRWLDPYDAAAAVVPAIRRGELYAITHPEWFGEVQRRHDALTAAFSPPGD